MDVADVEQQGGAAKRAGQEDPELTSSHRAHQDYSHLQNKYWR